MKNKNDISIIIPLYNEEDNIHALVSNLNKNLSHVPNVTKEVIIVDDGSTDSSYLLLRKSKFESYRIMLIRLSRNFGSHAALRAGILHATGKYTTFLSADLQDPLISIQKMHQQIKKGYDIVLGCRDSGSIYGFRKIISQFYAALLRKFVFANFPKNNFDIVMFNEKVKGELNKHIEVNTSLFLQIIHLGFRQSSIVYKKSSRISGRSKWTFEKKVKLFIDSFISYSYIPLRIISILGIIMSFAGFAWAFYVVIRALFFHDIASGWPTLISVLMVGFGITNISLGIIAEYIWRTFDNSRNNPAFIIDRIDSPKNT